MIYFMLNIYHRNIAKFIMNSSGENKTKFLNSRI